MLLIVYTIESVAYLYIYFLFYNFTIQKVDGGVYFTYVEVPFTW